MAKYIHVHTTWDPTVASYLHQIQNFPWMDSEGRGSGSIGQLFGWTFGQEVINQKRVKVRMIEETIVEADDRLITTLFSATSLTILLPLPLLLLSLIKVVNSGV